MMNQTKTLLAALIVGAIISVVSAPTLAVELNYVGTHQDIGDTFFPGGGPADQQAYVVVPWRTDSGANTFSASDDAGQRYYGKDGYALFGTKSDYPNANATGGTSAHPTDVFFPLAFPNLIDLPEFVAESQVLASSVAGGYGYALIDDPAETAGFRDWSWGETQSPPSTSQPPYVKLGILSGWDQFGNDPANPDPNALPAGRWGFTVGPDVPSNFRVGVMTDGVDNGNFAPKEVFLGHVSALGSGTIFDSVSTGTLVGNRFVDMHFFDIVGAQEGDSFAFGAKANEGAFGISGISGFSFDVLPDVAIANADFDGDADVDGTDFLTWQAGFGNGSTLAEGDANNDGTVDGTDLAAWQTQYAAAPALGAGSVPEPTTLMLLMAATLSGIALRR